VTWGYHLTVSAFEDGGLACPPFPLVFSNLNFPVQGPECGGPILVAIVDFP
jgi:hypothetical protein